MSHKTFEIHFHHAPYIIGKGYCTIYVQAACGSKAVDKALEDLYRYYSDLENEPMPKVTLVKEMK